MKFTNLKVMNMENAFRGMRNPLDSWDKSDSQYVLTTEGDDPYMDQVIHAWVLKEKNWTQDNYLSNYDDSITELEDKYFEWLQGQGLLSFDPISGSMEAFWIGPKDMELAQKLVKAGTEHCKFLRQIFISLDITAPIYWWKEFDTYKIGTTANSTSTMHTLTKNPITLDSFERDDLNLTLPIGYDIYTEFRSTQDYFVQVIFFLENLRKKYLETKDKRYWKELIRWLPQGFLQTRTVTMSYANFRNIYLQRKDHKLVEWHKFCDLINQLPYGKELIVPELLGVDK